VGSGHLKIEDRIKQADGTTGLVANVTTVGQTREMFNLTVSEAHTYYVGQDGWLVHNSGGTISPQDLVRTHGLKGDSTTKKVLAYADELSKTGWANMPPVSLVDIDGKLYILDGHHRVAAASRAGVDVKYNLVDPSEIGSYGYKSTERSFRMPACPIKTNSILILSRSGIANE